MFFADPWVPVKKPPAIPEPGEGLVEELEDLDAPEFALLVRAHLHPRDNEPGGRRRWLALWDALTTSDELAERTYDVLEDMLDVTETALGSGSLDDKNRARATKFERRLSEAWKRLESDELEGPLGWAGRGARGFNPPARRVIEQLVFAVDRHRRAVRDSDVQPAAYDEELWAVLRRLRLDPQRRRRR